MKKMILPQDNEVETERGIVMLGANGSGKTRLGSWIDIDSPQKNITHRISAQKSLNIPENIRSMATDSAHAALLCGHEKVRPENYADNKKGHKWNNNPETFHINDYEKLLVYLFSEHYNISSKYHEDSRKSNLRIEPSLTKITIAQRIWEEVMPHRELIIDSGRIKTCPKEENQSSYNASEMSDGERVAFYLIGQCLSAQENSILIIDEPELHLHKSIQYALWDRIENERKDCLFVYLTHDVEFAASRVGFKKIWLKDYDGKQWVWEEINTDSLIPEELMLEVCGSRKKVLLVEGENNSPDVNFYKNIFSNFLIKPCGNCENVIMYTKAFRANHAFHQLHVFGLIDKDRRGKEEISSLEKNEIYTLAVAEIENLFATPEVLKILSDHMKINFDEVLNKVKEFVMSQLKKELEIQISERTMQELRERLVKSDLSSKSKQDLKNKFYQLIESIDCDSTYQEIKNTFDLIIENNDYQKLLDYYNRKNLASRIGGIFGLKDHELPNLIIRLSKDKEYANKLLNAITGYLPSKLVSLITDAEEKKSDSSDERLFANKKLCEI